MSFTVEAMPIDAAVRRVFWRLLPFCMLLYVISAIDRTNVGFAALQMNAHLGLSQQQYGFGAGVFFLGYAAFEVPSNLILARVGARPWIARIMITWGLVVIAMAFMTGPATFYSLRFLLGIAEAGFLPGIVFYLNSWIPAERRARAFAILLCGPVIANIIAGPLAGILLGLDGLSGLAGWQVLMIAEGLPAVLLGIVTLFALTEKPADAAWLSDAECDALTGVIAAQERVNVGATRFKDVLRSAAVWKLTGFVFFLQLGNYGVILWLPQIIKSFGTLSNQQVALLSSAPYILAAIGMLLLARHSDRTGERRRHLACSMLLAALGLAASALLPNPMLAYAGLCLAAIGISSTFGVFWALPGTYLRGTAAAGGLAFINSLGLLGGFFGPYVVGLIRGATTGFTASLLTLTAFAIIAGLIALTLPPPAAQR